MDSGRSSRGWLAAITVATTLSLVFLVVEKHIRIPTPGFFQAPESTTSRGATTAHRGILLTDDPGLAGVENFPATDKTPIARQSGVTDQGLAANLLRRPPEPAASVALQAPVASEQLTELPLYSSSSKIDYLMDTMDQALKSPIIQAASARRLHDALPPIPVNADRLSSLPTPTGIAAKIPEPTSLYLELEQLQQMVEPLATGQLSRLSSTGSHPVSRTAYLNISASEAQSISFWIQQTQVLLDRVVAEHGLEHPVCQLELQELESFAFQASRLGDSLTNYQVARQLYSLGYSLQRRVAVWEAIHACLADGAATIATPRNPQLARAELAAAIQSVEASLYETGDVAAWRKYLLLDELSAWVAAPQEIWQEGNNLALIVMSRLHWQRLNEKQKRFLAQPVFDDLAANLSTWGRDPVDYRQLLTELEMLEEDPISRVASSLANTVQILRLSSEDQQKKVASALNNHYRNANLRMSLSQELIERILPESQPEIRPVRQRILGADTSGDSTIQTQIKLKLIPDETAWNVGVGVQGDMVSSTRSSKGPAVFHNMSTAHIDSHRYVRLDAMGYQVSSQPTNVASQDYLRRMSTDFDGLPIIGDLARFLVREQFDQKRGLAQRISRKIIAHEADAELDRRLDENLERAEKELQQRLVGPLEQLNLNPIVVAMNTTADRLTIRYRVANESQMAAQSPRPRAPSDSLLSVQLHQSAINNSIAQVGFSGRDWTLSELYQRLAEVFQQSNWELPEDLPHDLVLRFADTRPATVELEDGKLRLTLRIALLHQPNKLHIERFIVSSTYIPIADGLTAELIRDGVVEVNSHPHDRFKLRVIFAKVFVSNPQIPLISERWSADSRSEGLAVSQVEIRDGWLAVAISKADSQMAAEVAARAQQLRLLK